MKLLEESVTDAAKNVVEDLRKDGGIGGVIALDEKGTREYFSLQLRLS
jgi:beta-aspartyl-peptidase (threonine type)